MTRVAGHGALTAALAAVCLQIPGFAGAADSADELFIVDCLLPGQVRQLGRRTTYVSARRPIKTTAGDCAIRGGEYVAYDRASYRTALNVWVPLAKEGDAEARTNVGEIYEKGLGSQPDYETAANWYRLAADQGNTRAQINLGHLYEKGLGVEQDPIAALSWYRRASGLDALIDMQSNAVIAGQGAELEALRLQVNRLNSETTDLRSELEATRLQLDTSEREAPQDEAKMPDDGADAASQDVRNEQALAQASAEAVLEQLQLEISQRTLEAAEFEELLQSLTGQIAAARVDLNDNKTELAQKESQMERASQELEGYEEQSELRRSELATMAIELQQRESKLDSQSAKLIRLKNEATRLDTEVHRRSTELTALQAKEKALKERVLAGPEIALIDPQLATTRGIAVVGVPSRTETRQIVGRVTAPAGLLSLTVNDLPAQANDMGVFATSVGVGAERTPVSIIAIDEQGKRDDLDFFLRSDRPAGVDSSDATTREVRVPPVEFGRYHALVIGNNAYQHLPRLGTAVNDAKQLATILERDYGFATTTLLDADRYQILSALNNYRESLTKQDNLLIYYAGHGELDEVNMRGHWLPVDAEMNSTANWLSNIAITDILNVMQAKQILVIVDSCYSGALTRSAMARLEVGMTDEERMHWLRTMAQKRARMVFTSGGLAPVLDSGGGAHSVFANALIQVLQNNADLIDGQRLYRDVAARVAYAAAEIQFDQVPQYAPIRHAGHEAGDFFFVPAK